MKTYLTGAMSSVGYVKGLAFTRKTEAQKHARELSRRFSFGYSDLIQENDDGIELTIKTERYKNGQLESVEEYK